METCGQGLLLAERTSNPAVTAGSSTYILIKHLIGHAGLVAERSTQLGSVGTLSTSIGAAGQTLGHTTHTYTPSVMTAQVLVELILSLSRLASVKASTVALVEIFAESECHCHLLSKCPTTMQGWQWKLQ